MASTKCFALIRGRVLRVTRLDACGNTVPAPDSQVVTDGFITVTLTANTDEGTEISVVNAAGKTCILDTPCPIFTGYTVEVAFCGVDPDLYNLMTNQPKVLNAAGDTVGFKMNSAVDACGAGFALEMWSNVPAAACGAGVTAQYGYLLVPFLKGGIIGDFTVGNDAVNFTLSGANSKDGNAWGTGPYNVVPAITTGLPAKLPAALDTKDHLYAVQTPIAPPAATCGAVALGTAATTAVAGSPGTYSPAGSYGPASFATIGALTASPATNWTSGQYITLRDGTFANWNGTAWAAGVHA